MDDFYEHICKKSPQGIPYSEAAQLMLLIFLSVTFIPKEFSQLKLSKLNLAVLFARLSRHGKIITNKSDNVYVADIGHTEHWENLVDELLHQKIFLDETFPSRAERYV